MRSNLMFNRTIRVLFMFVVMASVAQKACGDVNDLAAESLMLYKKVEAITAEMKAATSDLSNRLRDVRYRLKWFKEPPFDDKKVKYSLNNIDRYKRWIATREACIELAKITDANERAELLEKYDAERKRLLAEELAAGQPVRERIDELRQEVKDKEAPFKKAMKPYCLLPGQNYPAVAITMVSAQYYKGFVRYYWRDAAGNKQLASATIELKEKPAIKENAEMLDGTFYVSDNWPDSIVVWAGYFRIKFVPQKAAWRGREKIAKIVGDFIDLEGLAKIDASQNDTSLNALAMGSLACSKKYAARYAVIDPERRKAAKELLAERLKVKALMSRLRKPPADSEQLTKDRQRIEHFEEELKRCQARLDIGRMTDPNKRAAMIVKLQPQKKKLDAEKREIARPYKDRIKELTGGLKAKDSALNKAMKRYLLKGGNAYAGVTDISTDAKFSKAAITCHWKDANGDALCFGELRIRDKPLIPEGARMLDGLYYISEGGEDWIKVFWAGNFHVFFMIEKKQWQGKKRVGEMVKQFVDLKGLAKINVTKEVK